MFKILSQPDLHRQYTRCIIDRPKRPRHTDMGSVSTPIAIEIWAKLVLRFRLGIFSLCPGKRSLVCVIHVYFSRTFLGYSPCLAFSHRFLPHSGFPVCFEAEYLWMIYQRAAFCSLLFLTPSWVMSLFLWRKATATVPAFELTLPLPRNDALKRYINHRQHRLLRLYLEISLSLYIDHTGALPLHSRGADTAVS